jgi:hypothetical protein
MQNRNFHWIFQLGTDIFEKTFRNILHNAQLLEIAILNPLEGFYINACRPPFPLCSAVIRSKGALAACA